jgi:hypothetical protein
VKLNQCDVSERLTCSLCDLAAVHQIPAPIRRRRPDGACGQRDLGAGQNCARTLQTSERRDRPAEGEPPGPAPGSRQVKRETPRRIGGAERPRRWRDRVAAAACQEFAERREETRVARRRRRVRVPAASARQTGRLAGLQDRAVAAGDAPVAAAQVAVGVVALSRAAVRVEQAASGDVFPGAPCAVQEAGSPVLMRH